jgi:hypothetical protein
VVVSFFLSTTDEQQKEWLEPLYELLRKLVNEEKYSHVRIYGGCFGHQALAQGSFVCENCSSIFRFIIQF